MINKKHFSSFWEKLVGNKSDTSLEARIFHSVCITSFLALAINVFFILFLGIYELAVVLTVLIVAVSFIFYLSRIKKRTLTGIVIFVILNNLLLLVNFYYNSGINGPSTIIFLISIFLAIAILPKKQYRIWIPLNLVLVLGMLWIQFIYPDWIVNTYSSESVRYIDTGYTYVFCVALMLMVIMYILNAYESERKAVRKKAEDLESSNATKDKLLSIIAHDLKDPLLSIQGYLELLLEYNLDESEKVLMEKELLDKTKNTTGMLSNLLLWAKSQMEGVNVHITSFHPKQALQNTLRILISSAQEKGITLQNQMDPDSCVVGDKDMFQLVIRNLVMNAVKFTHPGGMINIQSLEETDRILLIVSDNGIGISEEVQANVFSLKASSTFGTGKEKGIGLGLVLCKEFTELQGGKIWFESAVGKGTSFYVSLPRCLPSDHQKPLNLKPDPLYFT